MKSEQMDIKLASLEGKYYLLVALVGYGKSFCYSCLAYTFHRVTMKEMVVMTLLVVIRK